MNSGLNSLNHHSIHQYHHDIDEYTAYIDEYTTYRDYLSQNKALFQFRCEI